MFGYVFGAGSARSVTIASRKKTVKAEMIAVVSRTRAVKTREFGGCAEPHPRRLNASTGHPN